MCVRESKERKRITENFKTVINSFITATKIAHVSVDR